MESHKKNLRRPLVMSSRPEDFLGKIRITLEALVVFVHSFGLFFCQKKWKGADFFSLGAMALQEAHFGSTVRNQSGNRQGPKTTFRLQHFIVLSIPDARGTPGLVRTHIHCSIARLGD